MSTSREPFVIGQKVFLLTVSGQPSARRYEVTKVWQYPTTYRYLLDTGYVADHAELRPTDDEIPVVEPTEPPPPPPLPDPLPQEE